MSAKREALCDFLYENSTIREKPYGTQNYIFCPIDFNVGAENMNFVRIVRHTVSQVYSYKNQTFAKALYIFYFQKGYL